MNASPDRALLESIGAELGVHPSFIEKDWHAVRLIAVLAAVEHRTIRPVFSGGTSLSKGYGLIRRFSEDLDFKLIFPAGETTRGARRKYRVHVIHTIRDAGAWTVEDSGIRAGDESSYFSCLIDYAAELIPAASLRPQIKLEITFEPPALPVEDRPIQSFVAMARQQGPEVSAFSCVAPAETAADKLSALVWRVLTRQRGSEGDDPTLIRHLHDLAALEGHAAGHPDFPRLLHERVESDALRGHACPELADMTPAARIDAALERLGGDADYPGEYEQFVVAMSYAPQQETPAFEDALGAVHRLRECLV